MVSLEDDVRLLKIENRRLMAKLEVIRRWTSMTKEDEAEYKNYDDWIVQALEGSPTPVRDEPAGRPSLDTNVGRNEIQRQLPKREAQPTGMEESRRLSDTAPKTIDEKRNKRGIQSKSGRDTQKKENWQKGRDNDKDERNKMDIDGEEEIHRGNGETGNRDFKNWSESKKTHKKYLEDCYWSHIGLPIERWQNIDIYSFTGYRVAKGYQKVVTTCQGMYYEIASKQVDWSKMGDSKLTVGGDLCWRGEGVTIYKPTRELANTPVVPHKFAINIGQHNQTSRLRTDRYYIHVYQTKIGPWRKTLRSKEMTVELSKRLGKVYYPRPRDLPREQRGIQQGERGRPIRVSQRKHVWEQRRGDRYQISTQTTRANEPPREKPRTGKGGNKSQREQLTDKVQKLTEVLEKMMKEKGGF